MLSNFGFHHQKSIELNNGILVYFLPILDSLE